MSMKVISLGLFVLALAGLVEANHFHVHRHQDSGKYALRKAASSAEKLTDGIIKVFYNDSIVEYGWGALKISRASGVRNTKTSEYWYAAGFAEGQLMQERIWQMWVNTINPTNAPWPYLPKKTEQWIRTHIAWMQNQVRRNAGADDKYWQTVSYILTQTQGLADGYAAVAPASQMLSFFDIFVTGFQDELGDVMAAVGESEHQIKRTSYKKGGCSAFIRPTHDDLFMAHTTWGGYNSMLRTYKDYDFGDVRVAFSSSPALLSSGDDWYILSSGLSVQETTNNVNNDNLYRFTIPESVSEWIRAMVSHQLATDGNSWANTFRRYNSGTYSNQYMVVDHNLFVPGTAVADLPDNLVWIASQMPGMVPIADVTSVVREQGYWASYNIPYFKELYDVTYQEKYYEKYGDIFSYTKYARPVIFKREAPNVTDLDGMRRLMRYNHWQTDPASECPGCSPKGNPWLTIASRGDLVEANATLGTWKDFLAGPQPFGAIDAKIASYKMFMTEGRFTGEIISGPTWDTQEPFDWRTSPVRNQSAVVASHIGQPDLQKFPWVDAAKTLF